MPASRSTSIGWRSARSARCASRSASRASSLARSALARARSARSRALLASRSSLSSIRRLRRCSILLGLLGSLGSVSGGLASTAPGASMTNAASVPKPSNKRAGRGPSSWRRRGSPSSARRTRRTKGRSPLIIPATSALGCMRWLQLASSASDLANSTPSRVWAIAQSSQSSSADSCMPRRASRLSGWKKQSASIVAATSNHAGSRRSRWASSWAKTERSAVGESSSSARVGTTTSLRPSAIGLPSAAVWVRRTLRSTWASEHKLKNCSSAGSTKTSLRSPSLRRSVRMHRPSRTRASAAPSSASPNTSLGHHGVGGGGTAASVLTSSRVTNITLVARATRSISSSLACMRPSGWIRPSRCVEATATLAGSTGCARVTGSARPSSSAPKAG